LSYSNFAKGVDSKQKTAILRYNKKIVSFFLWLVVAQDPPAEHNKPRQSFTAWQLSSSV